MAVVQFNATDQKEDNIRRAIKFVINAANKGAKFVLLPEVFVYRGRNVHSDKVAERVPGPITRLFADIAQKHKVHILIGSLYEISKDAKRPFNTSVLIDSDGKIQAKYRKIHLFEAKVNRKHVREASQFSAGKKSVLTEVGSFRVGLSICFDLRFGWLYNKYRVEGADILVVPSAFTEETGKAHWMALLRARAIENFCYVLAPNQIGQDHRGISYFGHSAIISPWGEVIQEASGYKEQIIYGTLEGKLLQQIRKRIMI